MLISQGYAGLCHLGGAASMRFTPANYWDFGVSYDFTGDADGFGKVLPIDYHTTGECALCDPTNFDSLLQ